MVLTVRCSARAAKKIQKLAVAVATVAALSSLLVIGSSAPAAADTFTVNSTADLDDADPGDGRCAAANGSCTLRAAVSEVRRSSRANVIELPAGNYHLTTHRPIYVVAEVEIRGAGPGPTFILGDDRTPHFCNYGNLTLKNLTLINGRSDGSGTCTDYLERGSASSIWTEWDKSLTLERVNVVQNRGGRAALYSFTGSKLAIASSRISANDSLGVYAGPTVDFEIINSEISNNASSGLSNAGIGRINNVTISGNNIGGRSGSGGIFNRGHLVINNATITNNSAHAWGDFPSGGGIVSMSPRDSEPNNSELFSTTINNSIVAGNRVNAWTGFDCTGPLTADSHHNLIGVHNGCGLPADTSTWIIGQRPQLESLVNNGSTTRTHALKPSSPAIDAGYRGDRSPLRPGRDCIESDQRGVYRSVCDLGAFEYGGAIRLDDGVLDEETERRLGSPTIHPPPVTYPGLNSGLNSGSAIDKDGESSNK